MTLAPRPPRHILQERAARAAARCAGDINSVSAALIPLYEYARRSGLERSIGKAAVDAIIYAEFIGAHPERDGGGS